MSAATLSELLTGAAVGLMVLVAALFDQRFGRIPNWLTLPSLLLAPAISGWLRGSGALLVSLAGIMVCGAGPAVVFWISRARGIGGGDVKIFAALGAYLGPSMGLEIQFGAFLSVVVVALGQLAFRGLLLRTLGNLLFSACNGFLPKQLRREPSPELLSERRMGIPIGIATLCVGALRHPEWWS